MNKISTLPYLHDKVSNPFVSALYQTKMSHANAIAYH